MKLRTGVATETCSNMAARVDQTGCGHLTWPTSTQAVSCSR